MTYVTKHFLAEQVMRRLAEHNVSRDSELDEREVWLRLDQATNRLARENFLQNMRLDGTQGANPLFCTTFDEVAVQVDARWVLPYCELPAVPVSLPDDKGVDMVALRTAGGHLSAMHRVTPYRRQMADSLAGDLQGRTGWWLERNRLYFTRPVTGPLLLRLLVADARSIGSDAPYPVPAELQDQLVREVVAYYAPGPAVVPSTANAAAA